MTIKVVSFDVVEIHSLNALSYAAWVVANPARYTPLLISRYTNTLVSSICSVFARHVIEQEIASGELLAAEVDEANGDNRVAGAGAADYTARP